MAEEPKTEQSPSPSPPSHGGAKQYTFTRHKRDFGKVSVVGAVKLPSGKQVRRGVPIELSDQEVAALKEAGAYLSEVS